MQEKSDDGEIIRDCSEKEDIKDTFITAKKESNVQGVTTLQKISRRTIQKNTKKKMIHSTISDNGRDVEEEKLENEQKEGKEYVVNAWCRYRR